MSDTLATKADIDLCKEAFNHFIRDSNPKFIPTSGGVNNVVQYVETSDSKKYIMRIYNNGFNTKRVDFEHQILNTLKDYKLSFQVPTFLPSLLDNKSFVKLSNGAEACVCTLIPGVLPKTSYVEEIGRASGELLVTLAKLDNIKPPSPTPPYHDLFRAHHAVTREKFYEIMKSSAFDHVRSATNRAIKEIEESEIKISNYLKSDFPVQLIHGDLHYDNILVHDGQVSGLLDFEFAAFDWRAMELAVCLSKYAGVDGVMNNFDLFVKGFSRYGRLTSDEIEAIPDLIVLRILSNVVYFVGRAIANEDSIDSLTTRIENYMNRCDWVNANKGKICEMIHGYLSK